MFAVLTFERDPMRIQDVPASLMTWIQSAGGWAACGVALWLLSFYPRMRPEERARIVPWQKRIFVTSVVVALLAYVVALAAWSIAFAPRFAERAEKYHSIALTIGGAGALVAAGLPFLLNLSALRFRRIWALARLSFKEAIRNRVLYGFSAMLLVLLFGTWFIPYKPEYQVRSYVGVVYWVMKILLLVTAIVLAAFSIPNDIRRQTIHTITTKPVERFEIILGRFLGFTGLMTLVLILMTSVSVVYVLRGVDPEAAAESLKAREPLYGSLHFINADDPQKGINVGREWNYRGYITAASPSRQPEYAVWEFPTVPRSLADRNNVRCEFAFDIYRQTKGFENRGVSCAFEFQTVNFSERDKDGYNSDRSRWMSKSNLFTPKDIDDWLAGYRTRLSSRPNPPSESDISARVEKKRTRLTANQPKGDPEHYTLSDAAIDDELAEEYGYFVEPAKTITDYHTLYIDVPGGLFRNAFQGVPSGTARPDAPLIETRVSVTKQDLTQYIGMARYDLYWRLDDPYSSEYAQKAAFTANFYKGAFGLWLRLCLVIGLAVALSTYLSGVISMLVASMLYLGGGAIDFIQSIGQGTAPGGGPMEALVRLANRQVALVPLEESTAVTLATSTDVVFRWFIRRVLDLIPDVDRYDLTSYVGEGFNIPLTQLLLDFGAAALYLLPWIILAYYLLKWREIAAPT
jgi:ABC-type transport system involved in multi-copper enzyme maturation permease subunit